MNILHKNIVHYIKKQIKLVEFNFKYWIVLYTFNDIQYKLIVNT